MHQARVQKVLYSVAVTAIQVLFYSLTSACSLCLQALFKLPTEIIAAAMNVTPAEAAGVVEAAPTKNIYPGAQPWFMSRRGTEWDAPSVLCCADDSTIDGSSTFETPSMTPDRV